MGVGEDEKLEDSIAVTIIATGFNVETQNEIVNTETKKIIHTLEDEQRAEHNFSKKNYTPVKGPSEAVMEEEKPSMVVHTLDEDEDEFEIQVVKDELITPQSARNLSVIYEEVNYRQEDFIITDNTEDALDFEVRDAQEVAIEKEEQFMFTFDFPIHQKQEERKPVEPKPAEQKPAPPKQVQHNTPPPTQRVVHNLEEKARNIEVNEHIEIIPVTESSAGGIKRYSLDDYMEVEQMLKKSKPAPKKVEEDEVVFEKKTITPNPAERQDRDNHGDPFDNPISESLIERAAERRAKMKEFNYKFRNSSAHIEEIEKQPAYKRAGIELENSRQNDSKLSRTSIGKDDNDEIRFRSNNSFLHDNVD